MGLLDRVNAALAESRGIEARAIGGVPWRPWDSPYFRFDVGGPVHPSRGGPAGVDGALRLAAVYSCVRFLAEGVSKLPLQQYRDLGDRKQKIPSGPLLSKPSAFINQFTWLYQYVTSGAFHGASCGLVTARDGYGYPTGVEWLPVEQLAIEDASPWNPAKAKFFFAGRLMNRDDLLYIPVFTVPGRTEGISPLRAFQMLIESGVDALAYGRDWFRSGGFPPGTFQNTQYEVDDQQSEKIRAKLVDAQRRRVPLVYGRDWEYKPVSVPPNEAQFVEAMQLNATQIAAIYGVQPRRAGGIHGDSQTYSNVEMDALSEIADTLDPWLIRLESALNDCLPSQQYCQFNRDARLRVTAQERWAVYRAARDIGAMNVDEIRQLEDRTLLPKPTDSDDYDGSDYTPLQIMVAAARGLKQEIGVGTEAEQTAPPAAPAKPAPGQPEPAAPSGQPAQPQAAPSGQAAKVPAGQPAKVPAANGNGRKPGG